MMQVINTFLLNPFCNSKGMEDHCIIGIDKGETGTFSQFIQPDETRKLQSYSKHR